MIKENLVRLHNDKKLISLRVTEMEKLLKECKRNSLGAPAEENEMYQHSFDNFHSSLQIMNRYSSELNGEIERVTRAIKGIQKTNLEDLKKAFESFLLTDVSYSIKNVAMTLYDCDELLLKMRYFNESCTKF